MRLILYIDGLYVSVDKMKLRFHKILPDGKSVIFPKEEDEEKEVISLNVIVFKDTRRKEE